MEWSLSKSMYTRDVNEVREILLLIVIPSVHYSRWDMEIEATRAVIQKLNQMEPKPKFFIICGNIVDAFDCKNQSFCIE